MQNAYKEEMLPRIRSLETELVDACGEDRIQRLARLSMHP